MNDNTIIPNAKLHFIRGKAKVFFINDLFFWVPTSLILECDEEKDTITVPTWFYNKMKPDFNYIY